VPTKAELPILQFDSQADWSSWLERHHKNSRGAWLKLAKKASGVTTVTHAEALEEALCYGWIDGQSASLDESFYLIRFTPRRPRSKWSQLNREKVEQLMTAGRMKRAGLAQVEAAKDDGRWEAAYPPASAAAVPPDLQRALDENPEAKAFFETLSGANRYAIIYRVHDAKRAETRARRVSDYVAMLAKHQTLH
jgi:uncharacterized protein YdeI (YjbR/CyaY-like superfamily)